MSASIFNIVNLFCTILYFPAKNFNDKISGAKYFILTLSEARLLFNNFKFDY